MNLFEELQKAIDSGDKSAVERAQRKIIYGNRDISIDRNFINNIKDKVLYKNIQKIISGENTFSTIDYMKVISSLLTHNIIESEITHRSLEDFPIKEIYIILGEFINGVEDNASEDFRKFLSDRYGEIIQGHTANR